MGNTLILIDLTDMRGLRPSFDRIVQHIGEKENVVQGFHVLVHKSTAAVDKLQNNLPDNFVPVYHSWAVPEEDVEVPAAMMQSIINPVKYRAVLDASLRVYEKIFVDNTIDSVHAICANELYNMLFERISRSVDLTVYSPYVSMRQHAHTVVSWQSFENEFLFKQQYPTSGYVHRSQPSQQFETQGNSL